MEKSAVNSFDKELQGQISMKRSLERSGTSRKSIILKEEKIEKVTKLLLEKQVIEGVEFLWKNMT